MGFFDSWKKDNPAVNSEKQISNVEFTLKSVDKLARKEIFQLTTPNDFLDITVSGLVLLGIRRVSDHKGDVYFGYATGADGYSSFISNRISTQIPDNYYYITGNGPLGTLRFSSPASMGWVITVLQF